MTGLLTMTITITVTFLSLLKRLHLFFYHDDVIKWKHFLRYWPFVRWIHRSSVNSPYKGQWRGALMFSLICARINGWVNNGEAGDLRRHRAHYDVIVMPNAISAALTSGTCDTSTSIARARTEVINTLRPRQNRHHFPDDIFKCIFLNENV